MKILVIDNYDSFTYNLVHYIEKVISNRVDVKRNDELTLNGIAIYDKICISPGPGLPVEAGIIMQVIKKFGSQKSILGVCLGHQAIGQVYGAKLINLPAVMHGVARKTHITQPDYLFKKIPVSFNSARYHSWVIDIKNNNHIETIAVDDNGYAIAIRHKEYDLRGVQFHPESILTEYGLAIIKNWIKH